jgi:hypothetical protein
MKPSALKTSTNISLAALRLYNNVVWGGFSFFSFINLASDETWFDVCCSADRHE